MSTANAKAPAPVIPPSIPASLDPAHCRAAVGDEPMIFHCHHYNTFLQQSIQDAEYIDSRRFLVGAANEVAFGQLSKLFREEDITDVSERARMAETLFQWAGFGRVDLSGLTDKGGVVETPHSHYSHAWKVKMGEADAPVDFFTTGWLSGALAAIHDKPQGWYSSEQTHCIAVGAEQNRYELSATGEPDFDLYKTPGMGPLTDHKPRPIPESPVDYEGIFTALTGMEIVGDETGSIPAFGVYLTRHYANYYNRISFEFSRELERCFGEEGVSVAEPLLVEAGHVCAFNTFGGIMISPEWDALIKPQLKTQEDWVHGMVAAVNALGWGRWQVTSLSPDEAVFAIHDDYEAVGYIANYGEAAYPVSFLAKGAALGIMNLVYLGDVHEKPTFTPEFYQRLFKSNDSYEAEVLENRAGGDEVTAFRVFRR